MKKHTLSNLLLSGLITLLLLGGFSLPVSAGHEASPVLVKGGGNKIVPAPARATNVKIETFITLIKPQPVGLQESFTLEGTLKDALGRPVKDRSVLFNLDGLYLGQAHTDAAGRFFRKFSKDLEAGTYVIGAYWNGTHDLAPTSSGTTLLINPTVVRIQTVPAVSGLAFTIANQRVVSNHDGVATVKIAKAGEYRLNVLVDQYQSNTQKIKFGRWLDESFEPTTTIQVPAEKPIQVGLNVFRLVGQSFLDLDGYPVDASRITEFMIRSAQGDVFIFHDGQPRWIPASRVARRVTGLEETKLLYSVISVMIDGSNVVNQSQQRFYTYPTDNWPISLLLFSLRISAKDGLFGSPVGKSVNVEFPDGRVENYPLAKDGTVVIHSLARGNYYTELVGTYGMKNRTPVALSRNQDVNTSVITYLDMTLVVFLALLLALGLLLYGRPTLFTFIPDKVRQMRKPGFQPGQGAVAEAGNGASMAEVITPRFMRYETVRFYDDDEFKQTVGLDREYFERLLAYLDDQLHSKTLHTKLNVADQLLLTLVYFREHPANKAALAPLFGINAGTVRRSIRRVENALMQSAEFRLIASMFQAAPPMLATVEISEPALAPVQHLSKTEPFQRHPLSIQPEPFSGQAASIQVAPFIGETTDYSKPVDEEAQANTPPFVLSGPVADDSKPSEAVNNSKPFENNENEENDGSNI